MTSVKEEGRLEFILGRRGWADVDADLQLLEALAGDAVWG